MRIKDESAFTKKSIAYFGTRSMPVTTKTEINANHEDDIVFVTSKASEAAAMWVKYLTACYEHKCEQHGRPLLKIRQYSVEDPVTFNEERSIKAPLQIVIICPNLLERASNKSDETLNLTRQLLPDRLLAMMLGVHDGHLTDIHKSALASYDQWQKFFVKDQDEKFVRELLTATDHLLGIGATNNAKSDKGDKTGFSVHPKKVKLGHSRVIALLNEPLRSEDNVAVIVDRCGEAIELSHVKRRNPYTLQFSVPDKCLQVSMLVGVRINKNGVPLGVRQVKCESRLRELDQILRAHDNPLEFICQTFGFHPGDREQLDNWMVHAFQRNVPPHFNLLSTPHGALPAQKNYSSPDENPTLLHFAARFGLEKLAWQLLECPGSDVACEMKNVNDLSPSELAEQNGHSKLAHQLSGYTQMNQFSNAYSYVKMMSETVPTPGAASTNSPSIASNLSINWSNDDKEDYCRPRPLSEAYCVPPAARPLTTFAAASQSTTANHQAIANSNKELNYSVVPAPTPVITIPLSPLSSSDSLEHHFQGYMKMHPAGSIKSSQMSRSVIGTIHEDDTHSSCSLANKSPSERSRETPGPQDELLEIINDFKNNVFTISEVERLVDNWRNRNDVQQNFKEKQRQLNAMRDEYERIQKRLKEDMRAPTPFDRFKKFFSKGKKDKDSSAASSDDHSSKAEGGSLNDRRPVSSLSLHSTSSSSSSRMSTASGTSVGDSGTHSDPEDRRLQNLREDNKVGVTTSYEIPPAPKPLSAGACNRFSPVRYTPTTSPPRPSTINDLNLRRGPTNPKIDANQYYIAFPPSGLPIHSFKSSFREPKTPLSPSESFVDQVDGPLKNNCSSTHITIDQCSSSGASPVLNVPAGMCIPLEYMNVAPISISSIPCSQEMKNREAEKIANDSDLEMDESSHLLTSLEIREEPMRNFEASFNNNNFFPNYMNVARQSESGALPKKMPNPPVPPRVSSIKSDEHMEQTKM